VWQAASGAPAGSQAIQHGDLGPWNLLWDSDGEICGVLDWDLAGPGDPWYDTGHLAWFTVPFQDDVRAYERGFPETPDRHARLEAFAAGAGTDMDDLVAIVQQTQQEFAHRVLERARTLSVGPWRNLLAMGIHEKALTDQVWTRDHFGS
jgi:aminoglycoside phosphotransferase (APT) family kinase protein